MDWLMCCLAN